MDSDIPKGAVPLPFTFQELEADPYGCALNAMRILIRTALSLEDSMSEGEKANLVSIEEFIRARDNA